MKSQVDIDIHLDGGVSQSVVDEEFPDGRFLADREAQRHEMGRHAGNAQLALGAAAHRNTDDHVPHAGGAVVVHGRGCPAGAICCHQAGE
ncbi:hypothetical protein [Streptomyces mirabilis]|uniref:hypothetical protein n=1 Tax=Streptomyces mirabilis TaxID=68239 RepID=UPI003413109D